MANEDANKALVEQVTTKQWWKQAWFGNLAQWVAIVVVLLVALAGRSCDHASKDFDYRVDKRIDDKLQPAVGSINDHIDKKVDPLSKQQTELTGRIANVEGQLEMLRSSLKRQALEQSQLSDRLVQQEALNRVQDPSRILAAIRTEIRIAESEGKLLPVSQVNDYRNAIRAIPSSEMEYWTTVAAIINYQSFLHQMRGEAPDPAKVAHPCGNWTHNHVIGARFSNCVMDLDTNAFQNVTFSDSVVRYSGGPVFLINVRFVNCRFILKIPPGSPPPEPRKLLVAILDSPDQKAVRIP